MNENFEINEEIVKKSGGALREIVDWVLCLVIAVAVAMFIKSYIMTVAKVDGNSMLDTLHHNERLIVWKLGYTPQRNDIVIFQPQVSTREHKVFYVKRVIATENQTVRIDYDTNSVYVDGKKIDEPYIYEQMRDITYTNEDYWIVPNGHVFVMGDNRNNSSDSRSESVGFVDCNSIEGKVVFRFWPLSKMGIVK